MAASAWIRNQLREAKLPFEEVTHSTIFTAQELAHKERTSGHSVAKVVVVVADGQPHMLVLPAARQVVLPKVREILEATFVRFATETEMRGYCDDCQVGTTPPLPHWNQVPILVDYHMEVEGNILFQAGTHSDGIVMAYADWQEFVNPKRAHFSTGKAQPMERSCFRDEKKANLAIGR